jgi:predicted dehydrogenase
MCWADTLYHPIAAEDQAIALIRYESGAIGQFEVSWAFRGGMDLRDEVAGTEGTIMLNHFLRTGFEMFTTGAAGGYVAEKSETEKGWLFPVGDEVHALGYVHMFTDMFEAMEQGRRPMEDFYDGYVVNAVIDACYRSVKSKQWEPIKMEWRGGTTKKIGINANEYEGQVLIKEERMPDGRVKRILKNKTNGVITETVG